MADTALDTGSMLFGSDYQPPPEQPPPAQPPAAQPLPQAPPRAFEPGWMPPVQQAQQGQQTQQAAPEQFDIAQEEAARQFDEEQAYKKRILSHDTGKEIVTPNQITLDDLPTEAAQLNEMREIINGLSDRKVRDKWAKEYDRRRKDVEAKIFQQNRAADRAYQAKVKDQLRQEDSRYMMPTERGRQMDFIQSVGDTYKAQTDAEMQSKDPQEQLGAEYNFTVSPWNTLPGTKPKDGGQPKYDKLYELATNIAVANRHLQGDSVMKAVLAMASPPGVYKDGTVQPDPNLVGNNRRGISGTNYTVEGRDLRDRYMLKIGGTYITVSPDEKRTIDKARAAGYAAGQKWLENQRKLKAESDKPGLLERGYQMIWPPLPPKGP